MNTKITDDSKKMRNERSYLTGDLMIKEAQGIRKAPLQLPQHLHPANPTMCERLSAEKIHQQSHSNHLQFQSLNIFADLALLAF